MRAGRGLPSPQLTVALNSQYSATLADSNVASRLVNVVASGNPERV